MNGEPTEEPDVSTPTTSNTEPPKKRRKTRGKKPFDSQFNVHFHKEYSQ